MRSVVEMQRTIILAAALVAVALSFDAQAPASSGPSIKGNGPGPQATPRLYWRCGKNNPADFGTFGNGCLKQKRNWGKSGAQSPAKMFRR